MVIPSTIVLISSKVLSKSALANILTPTYPPPSKEFEFIFFIPETPSSLSSIFEEIEASTSEAEAPGYGTIIVTAFGSGTGKNSAFIEGYDTKNPPTIKKNINRFAGTLLLTNQVTILRIIYKLG